MDCEEELRGPEDVRKKRGYLIERSPMTGE